MTTLNRLFKIEFERGKLAKSAFSLFLYNFILNKKYTSQVLSRLNSQVIVQIPFYYGRLICLSSNFLGPIFSFFASNCSVICYVKGQFFANCCFAFHLISLFCLHDFNFVTYPVSVFTPSYKIFLHNCQLQVLAQSILIGFNRRCWISLFSKPPRQPTSLAIPSQSSWT